MRKNMRLLLLAAVVLTAMCISDGCGNGETGSADGHAAAVFPVGQEKTLEETQEQKEDADAGNGVTDTADANAPDAQQGSAEPQNSESAQDMSVGQTDTQEKTADVPEDALAELSVDVESIEGDSVIGSRIETYEEEGGKGEIAVSSAVAEGKELITIRFSQNAAYTYHIIRDGGADVETREGSFADIKEGMILNLTGHYDGETFLADTVTISDVRLD